MHLAYCLHVAPPLGTRLLHGQKCGREGTVEEEVGRMSNTAITGLSFQWVLLTWRFVSSGQTVNKRRTQPMKNRDIGAMWNPPLVLARNPELVQTHTRDTSTSPSRTRRLGSVPAQPASLFSTQLAISRGSVSFLFASRTLGQKGRLATGT